MNEKLKNAIFEVSGNNNKGILWNDENKKYLLKIDFDECLDADDPREWDNLATMIFWNRSYKLGDAHDFADPIDFIQNLAAAHGVNIDELDETEKEKFSFLEDKIKNDVLIWPVWIYDHSGIILKCGARNYPFNDRWDSDFLGYIYTDKKTIIENFGSCNDWKKKAIETFENEINIYNQYISGEVYYFCLYEENGGDFEEVDSCGGFYDPYDVLDYVNINIDNYEIIETYEEKITRLKIKNMEVLYYGN